MARALGLEILFEAKELLKLLTGQSCQMTPILLRSNPTHSTRNLGQEKMRPPGTYYGKPTTYQDVAAMWNKLRALHLKRTEGNEFNLQEKSFDQYRMSPSDDISSQRKIYLAWL